MDQHSEERHSNDTFTGAPFFMLLLFLVADHFRVQLLLDSLLRGALAVTQIHFLVITDAQNIRNQDSHPSMPIVQAMNDFYRISDPISRPRVFALMSPTADRRSHFDSKMLKLEQTLDAKVFGVTEEKRAEILALPDRPSEIVILYDTAAKASETRLLKQLHQLDPRESVFRRHYHASRNAHEDVGSCASDLVWRRGLKNMEATLIPGYADVDEDDADIPPIEAMKINMYNIVKNWPFSMPNLDSSSRGFNVSHKFLRLVQVLTTFKPLGEGFRGIIFGMSSV
jgi:endoribonuclease Dicer